MNQLFAIYGTANSGKSSSIRMIYDLLLKKFPDAEINHLHKEHIKEVSAIIKIGQIKIGIESHGDPGGPLSESLKTFKKTNCQIILCATRTRGATVKAVENLNSAYNVNWHKKSKAVNSSSAEAENISMANIVLKNIFGFI